VSAAARRVLVVGGAGVFGSRLVEGLVATTDAEVLVAGRDLNRAQLAAKRLGAAYGVSLDRARTIAADISRLKLDLVIDAAGPFQGADLSFAHAVISAGVHYIDLADARDFVAAFPALDEAARAANVAAITGASSSPALTHAALDVLTAGWTRVDIVRAGISPGNRAPRGRSVIEAALSWAGTPVRVFVDGAWTTRPGWSSTRRHPVAGLGMRRFALVETADLDLMAARGVREEAWFSAGLELGVLHHGLGAVGALRRAGIMRDLRPLAGLLQRGANLLLGFGSDRGGMFVEAWGRDADDRPVRSEWTLVAPAGVGPFVPTLPALVLGRKSIAGELIEAGARACVGLLSLGDLAPDFARHGIETTTRTERLAGPFEQALGADFSRLPPSVQASHRAGPVSQFDGTAKVAGAKGLARIAAALFGFPREQEAAPVKVRKVMTGPGRETWERQVGGSKFRSRIAYAGPGRVTESFGPFAFNLKLSADERALVMAIEGWRMGPIPLPAFLAPRSVATESQDETGLFNFDVPIAVPLLGRLTHYRGLLHSSIDAGGPEKKKVGGK
jgi:hypothetical protein